MPRVSSPSGILEWITGHRRPKMTDSAHLRFERMPSQAAYRLPEIHRPLAATDAGHWNHRGRIWDFILALAGAERVLDIGPGDGWPALYLAPHVREVVGIEPGERRVAVCRENAKRMRTRKARFEVMSATALDFPTASFDGVVAATSIEQTPDPQAALREVFRVLRPGGVFRMSYEQLAGMAEPVREAVTIQAGDGGAYWIDYTIAWAATSEQRDYLAEVVPRQAAHAKRLATWARRCREDLYPHRDPRLERGLTRTIRELPPEDVRHVQGVRLKHFTGARLVRTLTRIGFTDVREIVGGGWPAERLAQELLRSRRMAAAAPLMEELCRGAARIGLALERAETGEVIAVKPRAGRSPRKG